MKHKKNQKWLALLLAVVMLIGMLPMTAFAETEDSTTTEPTVTSYKDFMTNLKVLEGYADAYAAEIYGKDAGELVLNFIRTGVERYQDDNWTTLAGEENTGFTSYVEAQDAENGTTAMSLKNIVIDEFVLPNGNEVDFGHMFGCMNISYVAPGSADLSGWAGDICDLLQYSVTQLDSIDGYTAGDVEKMAAYIQEKCFGVNASGAYGWDDFYGDMDAYYLISEYKKAGGATKFSELMKAYFEAVDETDSSVYTLDDVDRTVYFMNNRFAVADSQEAVRKAIYEAYTADVGLKILESKRGLSSYNALRQACCYAFADYVYSQAKGKLIEGTVSDSGPDNGYYTVFSNEHSILAPGITQDINYAQTADGKQIVYYVATVDVTRNDVDILVNYNNNAAPTGTNIGLQTVEDQVAALVKNNADKTNFYPIVATNGAGYNITNGTPAGLVVMQGVEYYPIGAPGFFAILQDGSAVIGDQAKYEELKAAGKVKEAIQAFGAVLIKDGKINVTKNANYTASRASRTAIGITAEGKVIMMVLDGRQLPRSAGGAMEEIAQIMLEAGCVAAINLDGGGSTTYLSKPAGSDEIQLMNVPSDGYARSVATSLVAVSTAAPSTAFDHAVISSDYEYITVGTTMQFSVAGVSNTGNAATIPAGAYWQTSDAAIGTIDANGLFTAVANGEVKVQYVLADGTVAGEKTINVVIPDDIKFVEDRITAIYGVPKEIEVTVWYQGYPVAFTPLMEVILCFTDKNDAGETIYVFESNAGVIEGLTFTGDSAGNVRTKQIIAMLGTATGDLIMKDAAINLYYEDEATFDFENATQGNRKLAWNREIENAKTTDNQLYHISDPKSPVVIDYTFALDMTAIDFPVQLEPLKSMLPTYQEGATAWTYMLQLAERVCTQTNVTITAEFSKDLIIDISNLKVINDYFTLTSVNLDENNVLTLKCNWINQSQPIDAATANPLCILTGITATVKDTAAWYNNEILIANNGYVSYEVYLAASSLYSFASEEANQTQYGLTPYIHEEDCRSDFVTEDPGITDEDGTTTEDTTTDTSTNNDKGAMFSSQYIDFADIYVLDSTVLQGWQEVGSDYYYYVDNAPVTGVQLVTDRTDSTQLRFYEFGKDGKLTSENGVTGLVTLGEDLYYAVQGVAQTGWQQIDSNNYYFHPDTGKAVDGVVQIRENANSYTTNLYTYTFENNILVRGAMVYETTRETGTLMSIWRYRWAGAWAVGWFDVGENTYYAHAHAPYYLYTGFVRIPKRDAVATTDNQFHLFNDRGELQKQEPIVHFDGTNYHYIKDGMRVVTGGLYEANGYYYFVNPNNGTVYVDQTDFTVNEAKANGLVPAGKYDFDQYGRLKDALVDSSGIAEHINGKEIGDLVTETLGRVVTVQHSAPCKVLCRVGNTYQLVDAQVNPYAASTADTDGTAEYNFAIPQGATEVTIVLAGDLDFDGDVDVDDVKALATPSKLTAPQNALADINGNGVVNTADRILLALALLGKHALTW